VCRFSHPSVISVPLVILINNQDKAGLHGFLASGYGLRLIEPNRREIFGKNILRHHATPAANTAGHVRFFSLFPPDHPE
jgi:hypothetical protein